MTIKEILKNDKLLSNYIIEVNGELYDEYKHGDLIHIDRGAIAFSDTIAQ